MQLMRRRRRLAAARPAALAALALALALGAALAAAAGCSRHLVAPAFDTKTYTPIAIIEFEGDEAWDEKLGAKLADAILADVYSNRDRYRQEAASRQEDVSFTPASIEFVEREHMAKVLLEQDFGATERVDPANAPRIGALVGAKAVLVGKITTYAIRSSDVERTNLYDARGYMCRASVGGHMACSYKIVDAATGRIVWVGTREANAGFEDEFYPEAGEQPSLPTHEEVKARLIDGLAHEMGRDFYYYYTF